MLITSNYIMNELDKKDACVIIPNIHTLCNRTTSSDIFKEYKLPDICLSDEIDPRAEFSMVAGEFLEVYGKGAGEMGINLDVWDVVSTCFFIDTAHNIVEYVQCIYDILKKGGLWVNVGPLLYHYSEMQGEMSIELTWEEVIVVAEKIGFKIEVVRD